MSNVQRFILQRDSCVSVVNDCKDTHPNRDLMGKYGFRFATHAMYPTGIVHITDLNVPKPPGKPQRGTLCNSAFLLDKVYEIDETVLRTFCMHCVKFLPRRINDVKKVLDDTEENCTHTTIVRRRRRRKNAERTRRRKDAERIRRRRCQKPPPEERPVLPPQKPGFILVGAETITSPVETKAIQEVEMDISSDTSEKMDTSDEMDTNSSQVGDQIEMSCEFGMQADVFEHILETIQSSDEPRCYACKKFFIAPKSCDFMLDGVYTPMIAPNTDLFLDDEEESLLNHPNCNPYAKLLSCRTCGIEMHNECFFEDRVMTHHFSEIVVPVGDLCCRCYVKSVDPDNLERLSEVYHYPLLFQERPCLLPPQPIGDQTDTFDVDAFFV